MDLFMMIKEKLGFLAVFAMIILISVIFLIAALKSRSKLSQSLLLVIITICVLLICAALFAIVFIIFFGYNS